MHSTVPAFRKRRLARGGCPRVVGGFTLIELLIVVAIVAILASIAVPNFLEAQVRAKVSRVKGDMRSIVTALEAYAVDAGGYPPHRDATGTVELPYPRLRFLTSPVAYMNTVPEPDPFWKRGDGNQTPAATTGYSWTNFASYLPTHALSPFKNTHGWLLRSRGPDGIFEADSVRNNYFVHSNSNWLRFCYDATNGSLSIGEIFRTRVHIDDNAHM